MDLFAHQNAFMLDISKFIQFCNNKGAQISGRELGRTTEQQKIYFDAKKSKTMKSNHLRFLAEDIVLKIGGKIVYDKLTLQPYGDFWESLSPENRWGGNFKDSNGKPFEDTVHYERNV